MKKALSSVLAILLTLAMVGLFAACKNDPLDPTEAVTTTEEEIITAEPETDIDDVTTAPEEPTDGETTPVDATEAATVPGETTAEVTTTEVAADPLAPPANLGSLSQAEQLAYFNKVANNVRTAKPGFKTDYLEKIDQIKLSGGAAIANPIVELVKNQAMPGEWKYDTYSKGTDNKGKFMSDNANASDLKASDVASITSTKNGNNWIIKVNIVTETNPNKGTGSAHSRIMPIASRQDVLDTITDISDLIKADINDATLKYNSGYATVTVNEKGQVIAGEYGFKVDAVANNVSISIIKTNVTAPQSTTKKFHDFAW